MHYYKNLLQGFLTNWVKVYRKSRKLSQERMAEHLRITPRSYAYLEKGTYNFSSPTLVFLLLLLTEREVLDLLTAIRALVRKEDNGHVVA